MSKLDWFNEARLGMFIHWGPYAVAARGEWVANRERIPYEEYVEHYVDKWHAEHYDPEGWVALAKEAGAKYIVLTTRHHDGFALFDTKTTEFNAVAMGPKKDLVAPFAEAVRKAGLKLGFYFSPGAWFHPDYGGPHRRDWPEDADFVDGQAKRFIGFWREQIRELMTNYGKIDLLWYDGAIPLCVRSAEANEEVYKLQPDIIINDRNGHPYDFQTSEQKIMAAEEGIAWEACVTLNGNWGYHAGDDWYKTPKEVVRTLLETAKNGGNLLLNVGPKADGSLPEKSVELLKSLGAWLSRNRAFLPFSGRTPFTWNNTVAHTVKDNHLYLHFINEPFGNFCFADLKNKVVSAKFLATGEAVSFEQKGDRLFLRGLPTPLPDYPLTTIDIECEGAPESAHPQKNSGFDFLELAGEL